MNSTFTNLCQTQPVTLSSITTNPKNAWQNLYEGRPQVTHNRSTYVYKAEEFLLLSMKTTCTWKQAGACKSKIHILQIFHFVILIILNPNL